MLETQNPPEGSPFQGKTILLTGGSSGIGAETCREFIRQGAAQIVFVSRPQNEERARAVQSELSAMGADVLWIGADLSRPEAKGKVIQELENAGITQIDVLVNNAAVSNENSTFSYEQKAEIMQVKYSSAVALTAGIVDILAQDAVVVNIASTAGIWEDTRQPTYSEANRLLLQMTKKWAENGFLGKMRRIVAVAPGLVDHTGMTESLSDAAKEEYRKEIPGGKLETAESIARKICEVASPHGTANGQVYIEDGGLREKTPAVVKRAYSIIGRELVLQRRAQRIASSEQS